MAKQRLIKRYIPRTNQTHGLSGKEAHRLDVSDCADVRRHTGEPLNRYLGFTNDRATDDGFVRPGIPEEAFVCAHRHRLEPDTP